MPVHSALLVPVPLDACLARGEPSIRGLVVGSNPVASANDLRDRYVDSWIEANFDRCFQVMECDDVELLQRWVLQWRDLVTFEILPVAASKVVRELFEPRG